MFLIGIYWEVFVRCIDVLCKYGGMLVFKRFLMRMLSKEECWIMEMSVVKVRKE